MSKKDLNIPVETESSVDHERRRALRSMGRFAVYVAPSMTILLHGRPVEAHHQPGHLPDSACQNPNQQPCEGLSKF